MRKKRERYSQRMKPKNGDCRLIFMINITIEGEMNNTDNFTRLNIWRCRVEHKKYHIKSPCNEFLYLITKRNDIYSFTLHLLHSIPHWVYNVKLHSLLLSTLHLFLQKKERLNLIDFRWEVVVSAFVLLNWLAFKPFRPKYPVKLYTTIQAYKIWADTHLIVIKAVKDVWRIR